MRNIIKIAVLGATSHIAKNLIIEFNKKKLYEVFLFARTPERMIQFQKEHLDIQSLPIYEFENFNEYHYDVIINCVGIGDPGKLFIEPDSIFTVTEKFDYLIINYLKNINRSALYISLSSGAAYSSTFEQVVTETTFSQIPINNIRSTDYYAIAKINSEAKHRALKSLNIVDLRIFGFFSRYIDLESKFLLTQLISSLQSQTCFETSSENIIRDYVHPRDLVRLIELCVDKRVLNEVYDVYSLKPIEKYQILDYFSKQHGLKFQIIHDDRNLSATGNKMHYYSINKKAENIGYFPDFTSLDCLIDEFNAMMR